ncbi:MAG: PEP-CTERM sorting domain-containing protein [Planctomycetes bacterium]|nr:PEP-CTERM sorting domain-containing protein [Planctomycetota bacterium]
MLTSLYFDLGGPGLAPGDPMIVGGFAWVAAGSIMVGSPKKIETYDDLSAWWGYGNREYEEFDFLGPNIVSTRTAVADAFAPGGKLGGPDYGAASANEGIRDLYGPLPAVSNTVHVRLELDQDLGSLLSIIDPQNHVPYVEFGSNYAFIKDMPPLQSQVPEPMTLTGMLIGAGALAGYLRRRGRTGA